MKVKIVFSIALVMTLLAIVLPLSNDCVASESQEAIYYLFIGPYFVTFNDSHLMAMMAEAPASGYCEHRYSYHSYSAATHLYKDDKYKDDNDYLLSINIAEDNGGSESCLMNRSDIYMETGFGGAVIKPYDIHVLEQHDRLIDGHKGVSMKVKSSGGIGTVYISRQLNITQHCIFWMQVPTSCSGSVVQARVDIEACNYTEQEFGRVLDTFSIERLVSRDGRV